MVGKRDEVSVPTETSYDWYRALRTGGGWHTALQHPRCVGDIPDALSIYHT
jgi:hypothetical protein